MSNRFWRIGALGAVLQSFITYQATAQKLYWVDNGGVERCNPDGSAREIVYRRSYPAGLALDPARRNIYWVDSSRGWIWRSTSDGSQSEVVLRIGGELQGIALDLQGGKMYVTSATGVLRANLDGSQLEVLVDDVLAHPLRPIGIAVDSAGGKIYWVDGSVPAVRRANLDGSAVENLVTERLAAPRWIALDLVMGKMYWTDSEWRTISRANLDGSDVEILIYDTLPRFRTEPVGITLDARSGKMYWSDRLSDNIRRSNLDGSVVEDVTPEFTHFNALVFDEASQSLLASTSTIERLLLTEEPFRQQTVIDISGYSPSALTWDGSTQRLIIGHRGGFSTTAGDGEDVVEWVSSEQDWPVNMAFHHSLSWLYWVNEYGCGYGCTINRRLNESASVSEVVYRSSAIFDIAVDEDNGKLYWSESYPGLIRRANFDGSQVETVLAQYADCLAVDPTAGKLYWTTYGVIHRANLDGSAIEHVLSAGDDRIDDLLVDSRNEKILFSSHDYTTRHGRIRRCSLDGMQLEEIVTGLYAPGALTLSRSAHIVGSDPPHCSVDARGLPVNRKQKQPIGSSLRLRFSDSVADLTADDLVVLNKDGDVSPTIVGVVRHSEDEWDVSLAPPPSPDSWTCVRHVSSGTKACIGRLPGDVSGDGVVDANDIERLIRCLRGSQTCALWQCDLDRSGACNAQDILQEINLLNGAGGQRAWLGTTLPQCP